MFQRRRDVPLVPCGFQESSFGLGYGLAAGGAVGVVGAVDVIVGGGALLAIWMVGVRCPGIHLTPAGNHPKNRWQDSWCIVVVVAPRRTSGRLWWSFPGGRRGSWWRCWSRCRSCRWVMVVLSEGFLEVVCLGPWPASSVGPYVAGHSWVVVVVTIFVGLGAGFVYLSSGGASSRSFWISAGGTSSSSSSCIWLGRPC